jgi:hypothetical protein
MTTALIDILIENSTVRNLAGRNVRDDKWKIYPLVVPQGEKPPYIVVRTTSRPPIFCKGSSPNDFTPTAEVTCYAVNYDDTLTMEAAVINALDEKEGVHADVRIMSLKYIDMSEGWINNDGNGLYFRSPQFQGHESTTT